MLLTISLLWVVATAAPAAPAAPLKLAAAGVSLHNLTQEQGDFFVERLAHQVSSHGVRVITASEIATLLGYERQRMLLGCEQDGCVAEIGNALGVDGLITGSLGLVGGEFTFQFKVVAPGTAALFAQHAGGAPDEKALLAALDAAGRDIARQVHSATGRELPISLVEGPRPPTESGVARFAWIPAAAGLALAAGGTVFAVQARAHHDDLAAQRYPLPEGASVQQYADTGRARQGLAIALFAASAAAAGASAAMWILGREAGATSIAVFIGPASAVTVSGAFE